MTQIKDQINCSFVLFHYFWNGFVIFRAILVKITLHFGTASTGTFTEHNNLEFQLITEIEPPRILMIVHYVWYSNSVWFRIICVIFMQQILFQSVDTFFQYLYTIKCFITVRVDWFPFTEQHLKKDKLLSDNNRILFNTHPYYGGGIEDDHIPFLHRSKSSNVFFRLPPLTKTVHTFINFFLIYVPLYDNKMLLKRSTVVYFTHSLLFYMSVHFYFCGADVPILHLISAPFPSVWHRMSDDAAHIDYHTTEDFNKVFRVFVASYLHLDALHTQCRRKK